MLEMYNKGDVVNALRAIACASEGHLETDGAEAREKEAYRRGVFTTLVAVGLAFGLEPVRTGGPPALVVEWQEVKR